MLADDAPAPTADPDVLLDRTYRETALIDLDALTKMPGNPRRGDIDAIKTSMLANGVFDHPIVRRHKTPDGVLRMTILCGNHTYMAARELGLTKLRVDVHECDEQDALRISLAHNETQRKGGYDDAALRDMLDRLDDFSGSGFSAEDHIKLLNKLSADGSKAMGAGMPGDAPDETPTGQTLWGVIVECDTEEQQARLLEQLDAEGFRVRALL